MKKLCVYCGSSPGGSREYEDAALALARAMAERGIGLVYGGGSVGLMGVVAREALRLGVEVSGVITKDLFKREVAFKELPDLRIVETMHERKAVMAKLSDGFVAMPGGLGTLDEIFEAMTWTQLGIHVKPCGFLDTRAYYTSLMDFLRHAVEEKFIAEASLSSMSVDADPGRLLDSMNAFKGSRIPDKAKLVLAMERGSRRN